MKEKCNEKKEQFKILVIGGLIDLQKAGNQVIKNTIYYFLKNNFQVVLTTAIPANYPNGLRGEAAFGDMHKGYTVYRPPKVVQKIFYLIRYFKNLFKTKKIYQVKKKNEHSLAPENYFADYSTGVQFVYFLSWMGYQIFGLIQGLFVSLKENPDLFYGFEVYGAPVAGILGKILRKPVITRFQGTALDIKLKKSWKSRYLYHMLGLKAFSNAIVMSNDGTQGKEALQELGVPEHKINFWLDGFSLEDTYLDPKEVNEIKSKWGLKDKKVLLCVNKLKIWKRIDRAIYVLYKLKKDYQLKDVVLMIVGDGPERKNLENLVDCYQVQDSVKFAGAVSHEKIINYFSFADAFLLFNDVSNLGNQLLEALYLGLPIISLKDGSTDGLLKNNYNSLLVPPDRLEKDLPKAVYKILTDKDLDGKLSENARITGKEKILSWEKRMEKEVKLINSLLKNQ